jgi:hypothetical protein
MNEELIKNELQKYNVTDAAIAKLNTDYMVLTVKTPQDMPGYEIVKKARIDIKKRRVEVEKTRVQLKAESLEYGRRVDGEAKRITALLEPIENHLIGQEKIVDDEKARIKAEAEAKEAARFTARTDMLIQTFGATWNGQTYIAYGISIPSAIVKACTDEQFSQFVVQVQEKKDADDARLKAEEEARLKEQALILKVQQEQEAERNRLEAVRKEQDAAAAKLKADIDYLLWFQASDAAYVLKLRVQAEEIEKAKTAAIEQARVDHEANIKRQVEEKAAADLRAKIAAEKKAARAPDKVKLLAYADYIAAVAPPPDLKTAEGKDILIETDRKLVEIITTLRKKAEAL